MIVVHDLCKSFGDHQVLKHIHEHIYPGEKVVIIGPSGSGKSTFLRSLNLLEQPTSGSIQVDGQELTKLRGKELTRFRRERLGFIFQDCNLLDTLTAYENIALALTIRKTPVRQVDPLVKETAQLLEITECLNKYPYQMSGGQQQRTAAARAFLFNEKKTSH